MIKKILVALLIVCCIAGLCSCGGGPTPGETSVEQDIPTTEQEKKEIKIYLSVDEVKVGQYDSAEIKYAVSGSNSVPEWSVGNGELVSLQPTSDGCIINGLEVGETMLSVKIETETKEIKLIVEESVYYPVLTLTQYDCKPKAGSSIKIGYSVRMGDKAVAFVLSCESENPEIATVANDGVITAVSSGKTNVVFRADCNGNILEKTVEVMVVE